MNGRKTIPIAPRIQKDHRAAIRAAHQSRSGVDPPIRTRETLRVRRPSFRSIRKHARRAARDGFVRP